MDIDFKALTLAGQVLYHLSYASNPGLFNSRGHAMSKLFFLLSNLDSFYFFFLPNCPG
jgi:hypothetical protein